jgi:hypothetical protein
LRPEFCRKYDSANASISQRYRGVTPFILLNWKWVCFGRFLLQIPIFEVCGDGGPSQSLRTQFRDASRMLYKRRRRLLGAATS